MTREGLSRYAGLANNTAYYIEAAGRVPRVDIVEKLADALRLSPSLLAYGVVFPFALSTSPRCAGLGDRLRTTRESRGLTVRALARLSQAADLTIHRAESARTFPSVATAEQLADTLGVSPCWLAYGEGEPYFRRRRARL